MPGTGALRPRVTVWRGLRRARLPRSQEHRHAAGAQRLRRYEGRRQDQEQPGRAQHAGRSAGGLRGAGPPQGQYEGQGRRRYDEQGRRQRGHVQNYAPHACVPPAVSFVVPGEAATRVAEALGGRRRFTSLMIAAEPSRSSAFTSWSTRPGKGPRAGASRLARSPMRTVGGLLLPRRLPQYRCGKQNERVRKVPDTAFAAVPVTRPRPPEDHYP